MSVAVVPPKEDMMQRTLKPDPNPPVVEQSHELKLPIYLLPKSDLCRRQRGHP